MTSTVSDIMRTKVATCKPDASVLAACRILKDYNTSTVVVINEEREVLGVFSERDLVNRVVCEGREPATTTVTDVMSSPVVCGDITQDDVQIAHMIITEHVKKLPILDNGKLVGVVAESDLLKHLADSILDMDND